MYFAGQQTPSSRQSWLLRGACLALFMLLSACGFALRGVTPMPFDTLYVGIPDNSQFGADVRRTGSCRGCRHTACRMASG